jgi:hypothetical protein
MWKQLLRGSPHPIIVHCDHKNLGFYKANNKLMPRQARWLMKLQLFDMRWEYVPGNKLIQADALSRRPDHIKDDDEDNDTEFYVLIPSEKIIARLHRQYDIYISDFQVEVSTQDIVEQTRNLYPNDTFAQLIKTNLEAGKTLIKSDLSEWKQDDRLIYYRNKIYVPNDKDLQRDKRLNTSVGKGKHKKQRKTTENGAMRTQGRWTGVRDKR